MNKDLQQIKRTPLIDVIRATAWKQIGETGAASLSVRGLAREMEVSATTVYYYFKDRDGLLTALLVEAFTSFGDALEEARDRCPASDHAGRFRAVCRAYFDWAVQNPQRYTLLFGTPIEAHPLSSELGAAAQRSFLVLQNLIGEAHAVRRLNGPWAALHLPVRLRAQYEALRKLGMPHVLMMTHLAMSVWTTMHGITSLYMHRTLEGFLQQEVGTFVDFEIDKLVSMLGIA
jgi:AcrR family transcriptional regulator